MTFYLTTTQKNTILNTITTAAGTTATVKIYNGTVPASADAALSGNTLLVSMPCSNPIAPGASSGTLTFSTITQTNAAATGTASFYRLIASDGSTVLTQGAVNTSGAELNLNSTSLTLNGPVVVSAMTISI